MQLTQHCADCCLLSWVACRLRGELTSNCKACGFWDSQDKLLEMMLKPNNLLSYKILLVLLLFTSLVQSHLSQLAIPAWPLLLNEVADTNFVVH